ncbi:DUF3459 domain-containing protein, partial [Streptomyces albidoflavus]
GLPEAEIPREHIEDPMHARSGGVDPGRDGCRVPLPWTADAPYAGFSTGEPWLPQPPGWAAHAADLQDGDPASMLTLYRTALALRRATPGLGDGPLEWLQNPEEVLAFRRPGGVLCLVNLGADPVPVPEGTELLLASGPLCADGALPSDTAVWLREPAAA